jgi:hypothetical protein
MAVGENIEEATDAASHQRGQIVDQAMAHQIERD